MKLPRFLLGDNTDHSEDIFVVHTQYPRFILNLANDEVEWLEDFGTEDERLLREQTENLIQEATDFYDREIARYEG